MLPPVDPPPVPVLEPPMLPELPELPFEVPLPDVPEPLLSGLDDDPHAPPDEPLIPDEPVLPLVPESPLVPAGRFGSLLLGFALEPVAPVVPDIPLLPVPIESCEELP